MAWGKTNLNSKTFASKSWLYDIMSEVESFRLGANILSNTFLDTILGRFSGQQPSPSLACTVDYLFEAFAKLTNFRIDWSNKKRL